MIRRFLGHFRRKTIVLSIAAVLLGAGLPLAAALPAQATNCTFGDVFYVFNSALSGDSVGTIEGYVQDGGYTLYCQYRNNSDGGQWYSWLQKGTSNCITAGYYNGGWLLAMKPCSYNDKYQEFWLYDNQGGENWGAVLAAQPLCGSANSAWYFSYLGAGVYNLNLECNPVNLNTEVYLTGPYT